MKSTILKRLSAALLLAVAVAAGSRAVQAEDCCLILPPAPSNSVTAFLIDYYPDQYTADSLLTLTLSNNTILPAGSYPTWCVDATTEFDPRANGAVGTVYTGELYSTCDTNELALIPTHPGIPPVGPPPVTSLAVWHQINYILNHRAGYFYWDVQTAINTLVGGPPLGPSPPYPPMNPANVQAIITAAQTNAATWHAQCGDKVGVIFVMDSPIPLQLLIVEVPCCSVKFTKTPPDVTLGCNPTTIPDCTNPVDTNVVAASSCCGRPVTVTCSDSQATVACKTSRFLTYTATDGFGNTATFVQTITWTTDTNAPVIVSVPTSGDLGCNPTNLPTDASVKAQVTATESCSSAIINVSHVDGGTACAMTRTFTITASDTCGNVSAAKTVIYTWKADTTAPVITSVPTGTNYGCNPTNLPTDVSVKAQVTATDSCSSPIINVSHVDSGTPCAMSRTFTITASDACGNVSAAKTVVYTWKADTTAPVVTCPPDYFISNGVSRACSYSQAEWGAPCFGNNSGTILSNCFSKIYTIGYMGCGLAGSGSHYIAFTDAKYIQAFLPYGGNPGCLATDYINPPNSAANAGAFAAEVLALKLNVDFGDAKNISGFCGGIGDLVLTDPTCALNGKSVRQILGICHTGLSGGSVSNYGCTLPQLSVLCSNLNSSFDCGNVSTWCQSHLGGIVTTNVSPTVSGYATASDGCGGSPVITYSDVITAGGCGGAYSIARTWKATDACGNVGTCTQNITIGNPKSSVCGYVFKDCNGDGRLTAGVDAGISNIVVTLKNVNGVIVATATTDNTGGYCFYNLTPATYSVSIVAPSNHIQTAGCHTNHWQDDGGNDCWNENDGYQHYKGADGVDCWNANDGCKHSINSYGQDCWKDKSGATHTQNCSYTSCNVPKNNVETFTLAGCEAKAGVNFSYQGVAPSCAVTVTGPSKGICGKTYSYTCTVTNTGTACFSTCNVTACGGSYACPSLKPGEGCTFQFNYCYKTSDYGNYNCKATASCNYNGSSNPCTGQSSCNTPVGYW